MTKWEHKREEVETLLGEGKARPEIARLTGIPDGSLSLCFANWGLSNLQVKRTTGITKEGSKSVSTKLLKRHKDGRMDALYKSKKGKFKFRGKFVDPEVVKPYLEELLEQDMILAQMAEELEVDPKTITNWLRFFGLQKGIRSGSRCSWYKGGYIKERGPNWLAVRQHILERDNHTCQECGMTEEEARDRGWALHVHHLVPWRETHDNSDENLITVCASCHGKIET